MSSSVHGMNPNGPWNHHGHQFAAQQHLQLEEEDPYLLVSQDTSQGYLQHRHSGAQHLLNGSLSQYNSHASNQYDSTSAYQQHSPSFAASSMTPNPTQSPNPISTTPFTFTQPGYNANSPHSGYQSAFPSGINASSAPGTHNQLSASSATPSGSDFPMQFPFTHQLPIRQSEVEAQILESMHMAQQSNLSKRHRGDDDDGQPRTMIPEPQELPEPANRPKPSGACARCKSLKVRCEFRGDNDTCKRCTGAAQECVIPGRKPRRTPPKREHLLNQIREQAAQIQELMAELEATNRRAASVSLSSPSITAAPLSPSCSVDLHSPTLDPNTPADSAPPKPEVQDWIAKARASIEAFGGLIALGGTTTQSMLVDQDPNKFTDNDTVYGFDFEDDTDDEGDGYATAEDSGRSHSRERQSPNALAKKKELADQKSGMLPPAASPFGLMAHLSIRSNARGKSAEPEPQDAVGVASADFFKPSPASDTVRSNPSMGGQPLPHILTRDVVTVKDVENLFKLYFDKMNFSTSLLDPILHTPQYVVMRSPFLFTVVCAVASRFYTERPGLYAEVMRYAQLAAGTALITGPKNEEMCLAYILLQLYPVPSRRWEEDRSWMYLGVAIRLAQDLNLNRHTTATPLNEHHARVLLNRTRVWINCFNLDRSTGSQYGKAPIIPNSDYIANHLHEWWRSSEYNIEHFDIHLCIYSMELNIGAKFREKINSDPNHPTGLNKLTDHLESTNFTQFASEADDELARVGTYWFKQLDEVEPKSPMLTFRTGLLKMAFSYGRLVALSSGLQYAKENHLDENSFLMRCFTRASDVVNAFVHQLYTTPEERVYLRHAPEAQYVFVSFAGAFLVKLLQPKYAQYFKYEQRVEIRDLVQKTVDLLGAPDVALDEKHGPYLYSRFLAGLLASPAVRVTDASTSADYPSPSSAYSNSPSPSYFPCVQQSLGAQPQDPTESLAGSSDMFNGSMPVTLDADLLESARIMTDPLWQDTFVPGFEWMGQMQSYTSVTQDYSMYEPQQFGSMA
ncbi:uncharacterized protein EDB91DRAFT_1300017 [Suillus paluster]|uniref:uncharacterized protein n=1 Tax=Suillus paluster TaxID=48578 RepID=UPI001B87BD11|nr:uncharacterized protein EDB91DRAFT_1300017 [Suillus paluster]KAG1733649.1 hypothetical protein EDB91DRAFT_1300017 [Suillus paluster]